MSSYWKNHFQGMTADQVVNRLFADPVKWFYGWSAARNLSGIVRTFRLTKNPKFLNHINTSLVDFIGMPDNRRRYDWNECFCVVRCLSVLFTPAAKLKLADTFIDNNRKLGQSVRLKLLRFLIEGTFIPDRDERWIKVLREYNRSIKPDMLNALVAHIDRGMDNPDVKSILSKSKVFNYLKYREIDVQDKREVKIQLLRDIAQTQTVLKRIPFEFTIELDHIKELPPVTRLEFLKFAFQHELRVFCRRSYYWYGRNNTKEGLQKRVDDCKRRTHVDKLKIALIEPELIKDLLFSVSLQKNEEVNKWFADYTEYYEIVTGKKKLEQRRY